jgi:hypothetical protein
VRHIGIAILNVLTLALVVAATLLVWVLSTPSPCEAPEITECQELRDRYDSVCVPLELWFIRNKNHFLDEGLSWPWMD